MAKIPPPDMRELARRRLKHRADASPEEWAKAVTEARRRGCRLHRFSGLVVEVRDYSLLDEP